MRAGESLLKLVSDIKQFLILNDFHSVNEAINANRNHSRNVQNECDSNLLKLRDEMAADLHELEEEYYSSMYKWTMFLDVDAQVFTWVSETVCVGVGGCMHTHVHIYANMCMCIHKLGVRLLVLYLCKNIYVLKWMYVTCILFLFLA